MKNTKPLGWLLTIFAMIMFGALAFYLVLGVVTIPDSLTTRALVFEALSFASMLVLFLAKAFSKDLKIGFFVPALLVDIVNVFIVTTINCFAQHFNRITVFTIVHLVILFINLMITMPMVFFGIKEE